MSKLNEQKECENKEELSPRDILYLTLGKRLRNARNSLGKNYTQAKIAEHLQTNDTRISKIEQGKENPCFADIKKWADYLGVSLDWLCGKDEPETIKDENKTPWRDIPPILALLQTLEHFEPLIEYGETDEEPFVRLSFYENGLFTNRELLKLFFNDYRPIEQLIKSGNPCAEAIDLLSTHLSQKYKNLI